MHLRSFLRSMWMAALILILPISARAGSHPAFDAIYVFGDSYCDVGNIFLATGGAVPAAPYFNGRFSNGPIWIDHLAGTYGVTVTPSLAKGTDYAFGGAEVTQAVPEGSQSIPSIPQQVELYLSQHSFKADPYALYIVEGGGNDILDATSGSPNALGGEIAYGLLSSIALLQRAGARYFLVPRLFNVGLLPASQALGNAAFALAASEAVNRHLDTGLFFESFLPDMHIYRIDTFSLLQAIVTDGTHYGFNDVSDPCLNTSVSPPTLCSNPYVNFFWDAEHPTIFGHAFLAVAAEQAIDK
ncbi:SGNH/GDSL hydrolase family protein [Alloacidobacterium sp.]|uniref:SGNH/GDSL hydrolase family protein n=1 Tax=Alloacidobacterium sp. TaxID=2951999 RepID=UPI002D7579E1|nr:SGNH/GDSL hydrolase family protein [Alloacidobacterium sp.]HYK35927.1 SGNH/GDSL hydrolase family protein [Alloacidobacterium sp.]